LRFVSVAVKLLKVVKDRDMQKQEDEEREWSGQKMLKLHSLRWWWAPAAEGRRHCAFCFGSIPSCTWSTPS